MTMWKITLTTAPLEAQSGCPNYQHCKNVLGHSSTACPSKPGNKYNMLHQEPLTLPLEWTLR